MKKISLVSTCALLFSCGQTNLKGQQVSKGSSAASTEDQKKEENAGNVDVANSSASSSSNTSTHTTTEVVKAADEKEADEKEGGSGASEVPLAQKKCVPKVVNSFPTKEELKALADSFQGKAETDVVEVGGYPHVRVVPAVVKNKEIIRVVWRPQKDNCNTYRRWSTSCDLNVPMCAKYSGRIVFNGFSGVSTIPISSLKGAQLLGLEIVNTKGDLIYWRKALDNSVPLPSILDATKDPMVVNQFEAKPSIASNKITGWVNGFTLEGTGLTESQYKALPACMKEENNNFTPDLLFISVWQVNDDVAKDAPVVNTVQGGYYAVGYSSAKYTVMPGENDNRDETCF